MSGSYPYYKVGIHDLERVRLVASRVLPESLSPDMQMELVARSAGFPDFAAMMAALKWRPVLLGGRQSISAAELRSLDIDRSVLTSLGGIPLNALLAAGLAIPEGGEPDTLRGLDPATRLLITKVSFRRRIDYRQHLEAIGHDWHPERGPVYLDSMSDEDLREIHRPVSLVVASPDNQGDITFDPTSGRRRVREGDRWICGRVGLTEAMRFFEAPEETSDIPWDYPEALSDLIKDTRIVCFSQRDAAAFQAKLACSGVAIHDYSIMTVQEELLLIDMMSSVEGSFFSLGYYGTANMDLLSDEEMDDPASLARASFYWMCEMLNVVHGCDYEYRRISGRWIPKHLTYLLPY